MRRATILSDLWEIFSTYAHFDRTFIQEGDHTTELERILGSDHIILIFFSLQYCPASKPLRKAFLALLNSLAAGPDFEI